MSLTDNIIDLNDSGFHACSVQTDTTSSLQVEKRVKNRNYNSQFTLNDQILVAVNRLEMYRPADDTVTVEVDICLGICDLEKSIDDRYVVRLGDMAPENPWVYRMTNYDGFVDKDILTSINEDAIEPNKQYLLRHNHSVKPKDNLSYSAVYDDNKKPIGRKLRTTKSQFNSPLDSKLEKLVTNDIDSVPLPSNAEKNEMKCYKLRVDDKEAQYNYVNNMCTVYLDVNLPTETSLLNDEQINIDQKSHSTDVNVTEESEIPKDEKISSCVILDCTEDASDFVDFPTEQIDVGNNDIELLMEIDKCETDNGSISNSKNLDIVPLSEESCLTDDEQNPIPVYNIISNIDCEIPMEIEMHTEVIDDESREKENLTKDDTYPSINDWFSLRIVEDEICDDNDSPITESLLCQENLVLEINTKIPTDTFDSASKFPMIEYDYNPNEEDIGPTITMTSPHSSEEEYEFVPVSVRRLHYESLSQRSTDSYTPQNSKIVDQKPIKLRLITSDNYLDMIDGDRSFTSGPNEFDESVSVPALTKSFEYKNLVKTPINCNGKSFEEFLEERERRQSEIHQVISSSGSSSQSDSVHTYDLSSDEGNDTDTDNSDTQCEFKNHPPKLIYLPPGDEENDSEMDKSEPQSDFKNHAPKLIYLPPGEGENNLKMDKSDAQCQFKNHPPKLIHLYSEVNLQDNSIPINLLETDLDQIDYNYQDPTELSVEMSQKFNNFPKESGSPKSFTDCEEETIIAMKIKNSRKQRKCSSQENDFTGNIEKPLFQQQPVLGNLMEDFSFVNNWFKKKKEELDAKDSVNIEEEPLYKKNLSDKKSLSVDRLEKFNDSSEVHTTNIPRKHELSRDGSSSSSQSMSSSSDEENRHSICENDLDHSDKPLHSQEINDLETCSLNDDRNILDSKRSTTSSSFDEEETIIPMKIKNSRNQRRSASQEKNPTENIESRLIQQQPILENLMGDFSSVNNWFKKRKEELAAKISVDIGEDLSYKKDLSDKGKLSVDRLEKFNVSREVHTKHIPRKHELDRERSSSSSESMSGSSDEENGHSISENNLDHYKGSPHSQEINYVETFSLRNISVSKRSSTASVTVSSSFDESTIDKSKVIDSLVEYSNHNGATTDKQLMSDCMNNEGHKSSNESDSVSNMSEDGPRILSAKIIKNEQSKNQISRDSSTCSNTISTSTDGESHRKNHPSINKSELYQDNHGDRALVDPTMTNISQVNIIYSEEDDSYNNKEDINIAMDPFPKKDDLRNLLKQSSTGGYDGSNSSDEEYSHTNNNQGENDGPTLLKRVSLSSSDSSQKDSSNKCSNNQMIKDKKKNHMVTKKKSQRKFKTRVVKKLSNSDYTTSNSSDDEVSTNRKLTSKDETNGIPFQRLRLFSSSSTSSSQTISSSSDDESERIRKEAIESRERFLDPFATNSKNHSGDITSSSSENEETQDKSNDKTEEIGGQREKRSSSCKTVSDNEVDVTNDITVDQLVEFEKIRKTDQLRYESMARMKEDSGWRHSSEDGNSRDNSFHSEPEQTYSKYLDRQEKFMDPLETNTIDAPKKIIKNQTRHSSSDDKTLSSSDNEETRNNLIDKTEDSQGDKGSSSSRTISSSSDNVDVTNDISVDQLVEFEINQKTEKLYCETTERKEEDDGWIHSSEDRNLLINPLYTEIQVNNDEMEKRTLTLQEKTGDYRKGSDDESVASSGSSNHSMSSTSAYYLVINKEKAEKEDERNNKCQTMPINRKDDSFIRVKSQSLNAPRIFSSIPNLSTVDSPMETVEKHYHEFTETWSKQSLVENEDETDRPRLEKKFVKKSRDGAIRRGIRSIATTPRPVPSYLSPVNAYPSTLSDEEFVSDDSIFNDYDSDNHARDISTQPRLLPDYIKDINRKKMPKTRQPIRQANPKNSSLDLNYGAGEDSVDFLGSKVVRRVSSTSVTTDSSYLEKPVLREKVGTLNLARLESLSSQSVSTIVGQSIKRQEQPRVSDSSYSVSTSASSLVTDYEPEIEVYPELKPLVVEVQELCSPSNPMMESEGNKSREPSLSSGSFSVSTSSDEES